MQQNVHCDTGHRMVGRRIGRLVGVLLFAMVVTACGTPALAPVSPEEPASPADAAAPTAPPSAEATVAPAGEAAQPAASPLLLSGPEETYRDIPVGFTDEGYPYRGSPDAPITMYEYSDYECPFCSRHVVQTEPAIDESFVRKGIVRVIFRDFPLESLHPNARAAHIASLCVAEQGSAANYWRMHSQLFETASQWSNVADPAPVFSDLANGLGLDMARFADCVQNPAVSALVDAGIAEAESAGFSGTPSFRLVIEESGESFDLVGAQPYDQFASVIDIMATGELPQQAEAAAQQGSDEVPVWATAEGLAPDPDRPGYTMAGDQYRGAEDAPVTVVEFSDFQCPFCLRHVELTQPTLDADYVDTGKVRWVYKHFPLDTHLQAPAAGAASECAAAQGKFWEMHHLLFADVESWSVADPLSRLTELAQELQLDTDAFAACMADGEAAAAVQSDLVDGAPFVRGTPTFIVLYGDSGSIIPGALPLESFTPVLDQALEAVGAAQ